MKTYNKYGSFEGVDTADTCQETGERDRKVEG